MQQKTLEKILAAFESEVLEAQTKITKAKAAIETIKSLWPEQFERLEQLGIWNDPIQNPVQNPGSRILTESSSKSLKSPGKRRESIGNPDKIQVISDQNPVQNPVVPTEKNYTLPPGRRKKTSQYFGVTKYRCAKPGARSWEAKVWDKKAKKAKYLGLYFLEEAAAAVVQDYLGNYKEAAQLLAIAEQVENNPDRTKEPKKPKKKKTSSTRKKTSKKPGSQKKTSKDRATLGVRERTPGVGSKNITDPGPPSDRDYSCNKCGLLQGSPRKPEKCSNCGGESFLLIVNAKGQSDFKGY